MINKKQAFIILLIFTLITYLFFKFTTTPAPAPAPSPPPAPSPAPVPPPAPAPSPAPVSTTLVPIYTKFDNKNCAYGQIGDPNSNTNNYNYLGIQNSYQDCINAANNNTNSPNFKAVAYHEPNFSDDGWEKRCYGMINNVFVDQGNTTCGIKK